MPVRRKGARCVPAFQNLGGLGWPVYGFLKFIKGARGHFFLGHFLGRVFAVGRHARRGRCFQTLDHVEVGCGWRVVGSCAESSGWGWGMQARPSLLPSTRSAGDPAAHLTNYTLGHILLLLFFFLGGAGGLGRELFLSSLMGAALGGYVVGPVAHPRPRGRTETGEPPKEKAPREAARPEASQPSPARYGEPPEPRLGAGWGGCSAASLPSPAPSQAPTRPGRLLARTEKPREGRALQPRGPPRPGAQVIRQTVSRGLGREGGVHRTMATVKPFSPTPLPSPAGDPTGDKTAGSFPVCPGVSGPALGLGEAHWGWGRLFCRNCQGVGGNWGAGVSLEIRPHLLLGQHVQVPVPRGAPLPRYPHTSHRPWP